MITYSKLMNNMPRRIAMALLLSAGSFASLLADNKLSIDDITVLPNHNYVISVKMENDADITAVDANLVLPQGMTIVRTFDQYAVSSLNHGKQVNFILNDARTYGEDDKDEDGNAMRRHEFLDASQNGEASPYKIGIKHDRNLPFVGESGTEVFHFTVHTTDDLADTTEIKLTNIKFVHQMTGKDKQDDFASKVYKVERMPMQAVVYPADPVLTVNPDNGQVTVEIKMRTNRNVRGIDARIKLPAGLYVSGGYQVINNADPSKQLDIEANKVSQDETGTIYKMIMSHTSSSHKIETINDEFDDKIFAFIVSANDNLLDGSKIQISDITIVSDEKAENGFNDEVVAPDTVIIINNPKVAVKAGEARELVDGLQAQVDGLSVPQEVRDYAKEDAELQGLVDAADDAIDAAQAAVDALDAIVEAAIADGTVATPAQQEAINNAAQAAQDAIDAAEQAIQDAVDLYNQKYGVNQNAFDRLTADLNRLQNKLFNAEDDIERNYPEVAADFADDEEAIQDMIDSLRQDLADKFAAMELNGESQLDPEAVKAINDAIIKLQQDVKAAQEKIEADKKKFAEDKAAMTEEVGGLQDQLDDLQDALDAIQNVSDEDKEPVQDMIDAIQDQINAIVDALDDAENLDDLDAIADLILDVENNLDEVAQVIDDLKISNVQGDITGEGDVDIDDYYALLDVVMDQDFIDALDPDSKEFEKYDVNRNGKINSADLAAIINIYVYGNVEGPSGVRQMTGMDAVMSVSGSKRMALNLGNAAGFIGAQTDIVLPEGMSITGVELGELAGNHKVTTRKQKDGSVRILVSSTSNALFNGAEGTLVYINVAGNGTASFRNTSLISADAQSVDLTISAAETTGISSVSAKADSQATVYSLGGRLMNAVKKGVNIIRRADGTTKKVIR